METKKFDFEIKAIEEDDNYWYVKGYASTFDDIDSYNDVVIKGAFKKSLKKRKPRVLWQHNWAEPIGAPLITKEDDKGLYVEFKMPKADTFVAGRVMPQLKAGSIDSFSIGYVTQVSEYDQKKNIRYLKEVDLYEFSLVTIPANENALVTAVKSRDIKAIDKALIMNRKSEAELDSSLVDEIKSIYEEEGRDCPLEKGFTSHIMDLKSMGDIEKFMKGFGISNSEAKALISKIKASFEPRDEAKQSRDDDVRKAVNSAFNEIKSIVLNSIKESE